MAFLIRHPGLVLLPLGILTLILSQAGHKEQHGISSRERTLIPDPRPLLAFLLAFLLSITPQLIVNIRDTGQPLYSQQAKNIWLAVMGNADWQRWDEISNDIGLLDVFRQDPQRFLNNWWTNLRGFVGSGAEDTSEFGHAIQLRLLGFPANWLAVAGLGLWGWTIVRGKHEIQHSAVQTQHVASLHKTQNFIQHSTSNIQHFLFLWLLLYVPAICVGFALPRFFLPLVPVYALAAASTVQWLAERPKAMQSTRTFTALSLVLLAMLWGGFSIGTQYVLRPRATGEQLPGQDVHTRAAVELISTALPNNTLLVIRVPSDDDEGLALGKYSAIAHRVLPGQGSPADWYTQGARAVLWSQRLGAAPVSGRPLGQAGPYVLYALDAGP